MFTGIIQHQAQIESLTKTANKDLEIVISCSTKNINRKLEIGCSIACNGVCLTLVTKEQKQDKYYLTFQASNETINKTTLGNWELGKEINIEFALRVGDELGGHMVLGHVDGVAKIAQIIEDDDSHIFIIKAPQNLEKFIAKKGSVTLDGVSLTVNEVKDDGFYLNIIWHTMQNTIFKNYKVGDDLNLEIDVVARYINKN